jgi:hypothetical protein
LVVFFDGLYEQVELFPEHVQPLKQVFIIFLFPEGTRFKQSLQMIDRFIAWSRCKDKVADEFLFLSPSSVSFDDRGFDGFHRAPDLTAFFVHLMLWQFFDGHSMHIDNGFSSKSPDSCSSSLHSPLSLHPASAIQHLVPSIRLHSLLGIALPTSISSSASLCARSVKARS